MEQIKLELQLRNEAGSGEVKTLRKAGYIPGVMYGGEGKPTSVKLMRKDFDRIMRQHHGESILFQSFPTSYYFFHLVHFYVL